MTPDCGRARERRGTWLLILVLATAVVTAGCAEPPPQGAVPLAVEGVPVIGRRYDPVGEDAIVFGPAVSHVAAGAYLVAVRLTLREGAVRIVVGNGEAPAPSVRSVARVGPSLLLVPLRTRGSVTVGVDQAADTGPLAFDIESIQIIPVTADDATARAAGLAEAFERETGRMADPACENLIDNANFAADDEVRGTPRNWFAYVPTSADVLAHVLHVEGSPPPARPAVATGPSVVTPDRSYRFTARLHVDAGPILVRIVDYDELVVIAQSDNVPAADGRHDVTLDFAAPAGCHAVRVQFLPATAGARVSMGIALVQLEELP